MRGSVKLLAGLVGENIQGSLSSQIHEQEAAALGLELTYRIIDLAQPKRNHVFLESVLLVAESLGFSGLNITHPYKEDAVKMLDTLSEDAKNIGSVNTIVFREEKRHGDNTDWSAFSDDFQANLPGAPINHVAIIGTGGAGRAIAYAMLKMGTKELRLFDIVRHKAQSLADHLKKKFPGKSVFVSADPESALHGTDGFIQATPVGMTEMPGIPVDTKLIHSSMWVSDIVYFPLETVLLKEAKRRGCRVIGGGGMVVRQAAASFRQFFQVEPDVDRMLKRFLEA
jgi:shikimate dehydrogenase